MMTSTALVNADTAKNVVDASTTSTDMAHNMLSGMFGTNWDTLFSASNSGSIGGNTWSSLFQLFGYMNSVVMMGVAVMIFYVMSIGVIGTAHEGKPLGSRYSTLWTPLRSVFSVSLLMPIPGLSGISMLQALLLLIISVGSNGANKMWDITLEYMAANKGQLVSGMSTGEVSSMLKVSNTIMVALMTQSYLHIDGPAVSKKWVYKDGTEGPGVYTYTFLTSQEFPSMKNNMGSVSIPCQDQASPICQARITAVNVAIESFWETAKMIVDAEADVDITMVTQFLTKYSETMKAAVAQEISAKTSSDYDVRLNQFIDAAKEKGWISAGGWYWSIAGLQDIVSQDVVSYPTAIPPKESSLNGLALSDYSVFKAAEKEYLDQTATQLSDADISSNLNIARNDDSIWSYVSDWISKPGKGLINTVNLALTTGDPIANLKTVGDSIIDMCGVIFATASLAAAGTIGGVDGFNASLPGMVGNLFGTGVASGFAKTIISIAIVVVSGYLVPLFTMGLALSYYLPTIPFLLFTMGTIGWIILIVESLAAAPIWAAGHAMPEGEGMAGQHGRQGYMLFMNVLFRPPLMVLGFMATFSCMKVVAWLIGTTFTTFVGGATAGNAVGPITTLAMVAILTMIMIEAAHKIFGLITHLPENVMRWVGGQGAQMGETHSTGNVKAAFAYAGGQMSSATGQGAQSGIRAAQAGKKKEAKLEKTTPANELEPGFSKGKTEGVE
jgi:conjugal transfer/type IV secretion protein DotA/TraY